MKSKKEIKEILKAAFEAGAHTVDIDGVKYTRKKNKPKEKAKPLEAKPARDFPVPDGMSEEEILFYSTPYYDELQAQKKEREESLRMERNLRNG